MKVDSPQLSRHRIVAAALAEVDEHGVEAFSMRAVARGLGVYPTAVRWYVTDRDTLLDQVALLILSEVTVPGPEVPWDDALRLLARGHRAAVRRHPRAAPLLTSWVHSGSDTSLALLERVLAALVDAGFEGRDLRRAHNVFVGCLTGYTAVEFSLHGPDGDLEAMDGDFEAALDVVVRGLRQMVADAAP